MRDGGKAAKDDAMHQPATPIPLLVLCILWWSVWGWTFDDLSENTGLSEEINWVFFHKFIEVCCHSSNIKQSFSAYSRLWKSWLAWLHWLYRFNPYSTWDTWTSFEAKPPWLQEFTLGTITVSNRQKILATTTAGCPARWNDKLVVLFDHFAVALNEGRTLQGATLFEFNNYDSSGNVTKIQGRLQVDRRQWLSELADDSATHEDIVQSDQHSVSHSGPNPSARILNAHSEFSKEGSEFSRQGFDCSSDKHQCWIRYSWHVARFTIGFSTKTNLIRHERMRLLVMVNKGTLDYTIFKTP